MDDTFDPASLSRIDTSSSLVNKNGNSTALKSVKSTNSSGFPRIDLEPIYTDLKDTIGLHKWDIYFDAITRFTQGALHAREFGELTDEILYSNDNVLHLHNKFVCAIAYNSARDSPEPGVAGWVTAASDKKDAASGKAGGVGAGAGDAGEHRLKKEVMGLHARDRRRIKGTGIPDPKDDADPQATKRNQYEEAYLASRYKVPEASAYNSNATNGTAAGLTKTNWEPEIKKRYQQALLTETAEFPDAAHIFARINPICYEEAIPQGSTMATAELVVTSAEFFLKDFLSTVFERVRCDGPRDENSVTGNGHDGIFGGGVFTSRYKKQVLKEIDLVSEGRLQKARDDELLPIESTVSKNRRPLGINDFKVATRVGPALYTRVPLIRFELEVRPTESEYDDWKLEKDMEPVETNGHRTDDEMDVDDEDDFDWNAEGYGGRGALDSLLDDCLAMPA